MNYDIWPGIGLSETPFDWQEFTAASANGAKSTASVEHRRKTEGNDFSTFRGMSKPKPKGPKRIRNKGGKRGPVIGTGLQVTSKSGQIREALRTGPKTRAELAEVIGIRCREISAFLKNDIRQGRILKIEEEGSLQRFALAN